MLQSDLFFFKEVSKLVSFVCCWLLLIPSRERGAVVHKLVSQQLMGIAMDAAGELQRRRSR